MWRPPSSSTLLTLCIWRPRRRLGFPSPPSFSRPSSARSLCGTRASSMPRSPLSPTSTSISQSSWQLLLCPM
ncbi:hypothetical protein FR483_n626L [Paramecium bursaria Chlorella virus FR483]|uniref:Uncharacterized protein n626L n=1 Tax=Paramecium bursaria Chlorella virus FR483 TaxID=399781 RepID=A7J7Y0_PBCVF|nr:hypothetical protein FR483_n626L [Paramecium bursaria Chlorella virus FR483]ABT15911.1 hypothetical protein FR483_n626L [Paramecium bursaria Chlorella virus FR483]